MRKYLILCNFLFFIVCAPFVFALDTIVVNGKIVTVDDRFTIVQALTIRNQRVVATGSTADIRKLADANTKVIDVKGRTVIPGLIDNHSHWIRAAEHDELRFDGVTSRKQALAMLSERVRVAKPGEWVSVLGGHLVNRQTITREEALIAHTRSNAFILFQEANIGSLQNGKYADLPVLDRDYLTVPADAIKDTVSVVTMVGGKVVYERK